MQTLTSKQLYNLAYEAATIAEREKLPRGSMERFLKAEYLPQAKQVAFHAAARACDNPWCANKVGFGGSRGGGKALHIETPIPTTLGWKRMGDLTESDIVFDEQGNPTKILEVFPVMFNHKCYRVCFSDGAEIIADAEHLWITQTKKDRLRSVRLTPEYREKRRSNRPKRGKGLKPFLAKANSERNYTYKLPELFGDIKTTEEIKNTLKIQDGREINHSIATCQPLKLPEIKLPIEPYLFGAWLGDGASQGGVIYSDDVEILEAFSTVNFYKMNSAFAYRVVGLTSTLKQSDLINNKHIPGIYLRASFAQRLALLQGLMDTDGWADKDGGCGFCTTKEDIANGFVELAQTLGIKLTKRETRAKLNGKDCGRMWRFSFYSSLSVFRLPRKANRQKVVALRPTVSRRYIVDVVPIESVPVRCIKVDSESHCYLAGKNFIQTHNTKAVFSQIAIDDCQRFPNLKCLFLRRVGKAARESFETLRRSIALTVPHEYKAQQGVLEFKNGSRIFIGHFHDDKDIDNYLGLEYDVIGIEEATQLSESKFQDLTTVNRSANNFRPRMYLTTNPGGVGHAWFKRRFIEPARAGETDKTRFIFSFASDNKFLNDEYVGELKNLTGWKRAAWLEGDWDIAAGQFFSTFRYDKHVIEPFPLANAEFWCSLDYGFTHPTVCYLLAKHDGNFYVVAEHREAKQLPAYHAQAIKEMLTRFSLSPSQLQTFVAGADCFARGKDEHGKTIADQYSDHGIYLTPANNSRITGASFILSLLGDADKEIEPRLFIFKNCVKLIECLPSLQHDPNRPEDVLKVDADEAGENGDDEYDSLRYGLAVNMSTGAFL